MRIFGAAVGGAVLAVCVVAPARAGNGGHERTRPIFESPPCMVVVDRSVDPVFHLDYTIPFEDTMVTPDEVEGSRTHQFFALCRDHSVQVIPPDWVTWADVMTAEAKGLVEPGGLDDERVFETSTAWAGCWHRLNADDDRRPITFEAAAMGVDWDTSAVPAGAYVIRGYTFEPAINVFARRAGVIKVVDDPGDPAATGPAAAINPLLEPIVYRNETVAIEGCYEAMDGSTASLYWSHTKFETLDWQPLAEGVPVEGGGFAIDFTPFDEVIGEAIVLRVDITDPTDRTFVAHMPELLSVLDAYLCEPEGESDSAGIIAPPECETGGDATGTDTSAGSTTGDPTGTTGDSTGDSTGAGSDDTGSDATGEPTGVDDPSGCACRSAGSGPGAVLAWLLFAGAGRRRRAREGRSTKIRASTH